MALSFKEFDNKNSSKKEILVKKDGEANIFVVEYYEKILRKMQTDLIA